MCAALYKRFVERKLTESQLRYFDYPRPDPDGEEGDVKLYGDHFGFKKDCCKRCDERFDTTFKTKERCNFHTQRSKKYNRKQQPHGCCGRRFGSNGCNNAPSHVYQGNIYSDLTGYKRTVARKPAPANGDYGVYALDTESVHTKKGLEVCKVTVINREMEVAYENYCLPTTEIIDYNTIWSGIKEEDLKDVTKTFEELRDDLLDLFSKETILIGHGLKSDMMSLKILHDSIVDTLVLYPHPRGLPLKRSLKDIAMDALSTNIQTGVAGHDSKEDAEITMRLALKKCRM